MNIAKKREIDFILDSTHDGMIVVDRSGVVRDGRISRLMYQSVRTPAL